jgi:hypothetical protein
MRYRARKGERTRRWSFTGAYEECEKARMMREQAKMNRTENVREAAASSYVAANILRYRKRKEQE